MWEKDKKLLQMYRECMQNFLAEMKEGGEVDFEDACAVESAKVQQYTFDQVKYWKIRNPQKLNERGTERYTPKTPYFQNF